MESLREVGVDNDQSSRAGSGGNAKHPSFPAKRVPHRRGAGLPGRAVARRHRAASGVRHRPTISSPRPAERRPMCSASWRKADAGVTASAGLGLAAGPLPPMARRGGHADRRRRPGRRGGGRGSGAGRLGAASGRGGRAASPRSAPARSCWRPPACWMAGAPRPIGRSAPNSPAASPPCGSSPIRSSCATARSGPRPA